MRAWLVVLAASGLYGAAPTTAMQPLARAAAGPDADEAAAIVQASRRGLLIYAYDQAAWHGTDDMRAKIADPEEVLGGWIVDGPAEAPELVFFDKDKADPKAVYVAHFQANHLVSSKLFGPSDDRSLSAARRRMIKALDAAKAAFVASGKPLCSDQPFNSVVLPPERPDGPILVYLLTPQTTLQSVPFGGHHLIPVAADGTAGPVRDFTKACFEAPLRGGGDAEPAGLFITHLLDPTPTEIHVFTSLTTHMPVFVETSSNGKVWAVDGGSIRPIDPEAAR